MPLVGICLGGLLFTHLHVHTEFSLLDGLSRIGPLVQRAGELGMESLAITDHGGMYGAIDFYRAAREAGIKPIIGCEMYVAPGSRYDRNPADKSPHHMTVLAKNETGYKNLIKLVTRSHLEGFYYKPRVDRDLLEERHEGLVVLSGCPSGEVPRLIAQGRMDEAKASALWYKDLFEDYYLEVMHHGGVPELDAINSGLVELHRELEIPVVATNDSHYVLREDAPLQDILICIHTNTNINDPNRLRMEEDSYYLKSPGEMESLYADLPEALTNTERIAEMCNLELDFSRLRLPEYAIPDGVSADEYLEKLSREGLERRVESVSADDLERLAYELEVIRQTQFANYFLVVWDIARFVRENNILLAVRGSAAASLVLYCLGVTDVNPLEYGLVFERFLHVERKELPDVDMDFQDDRREEVLNYVVSKYGRDHVAQIITFGTLGARASIRDVGRALAMPYADVDKVARLVPMRLRITLDAALDENPEFREVYDADEEVRRLVDTAKSVEGLVRHSSTHAAGVVISEEPLEEVVPLQNSKDDDQGAMMTQFTMDPIASLGLLKLDFLGLSNLTILARTRDLITKSLGRQITLADIPLDDAKTFEMLSRGETVGVFQLEGAGMTRYIKELKPSSLGDVAAMIALYRPGPMEHIGTFIDAKFGRAEPSYPDPAFEKILEETYGVAVYQEQVLHMVRTFAGYSLGEADNVRKAMGKKIPEIMAQEREKFVSRARGQGFTEELAEEVFGIIEPFAGYAFNKAHSVCYGLISYWTAYLKANFPAEYMVSLLNVYAGNSEKIATAVTESQRLKIPVLPPSINESETEFSIEKSEDGGVALRFGMSAVKNVGSGAVRPIQEAREKEGAFSSIEHLCRVADMSAMNRKTVESLIMVGAFDDFGDRAALLSVVDRIVSLAHSEASIRNSSQTSMFEMLGESVQTPLASIALSDERASAIEKQAWEVELLGVALSNQGLLKDLLAGAGSATIVSKSQVEPSMAGKSVVLGGQVASVTERFTRNGRPFAIATLGLMDGSIEVFVWDEVLAETRALWEKGKFVLVTGSVREREDQVSISCTEVAEYVMADNTRADGTDEPQDTASVAPSQFAEGAVSPRSTNGVEKGPALPAAAPHESRSLAPPPARPQDGTPRRLNVRFRETGHAGTDQILLDDVKRLLLEHSGEDEVSLEIATGGRIVSLDWPLLRVNADAELERQIGALLGGAGRVSIEGASQ